MLDLAEAEASRLTLARVPVHPTELLQQAVVGLQAFAQKEGVKLTFSTSVVGSAPQMDGDAVRLRQAFTNLVHNAIKFTPAGGEVRVSDFAEYDRLAIEIADSGDWHGAGFAGQCCAPFPSAALGPRWTASGCRPRLCRSPKRSSNCTAARSISRAKWAPARPPALNCRSEYRSREPGGVTMQRVALPLIALLARSRLLRWRKSTTARAAMSICGWSRRPMRRHGCRAAWAKRATAAAIPTSSSPALWGRAMFC